MGVNGEHVDLAGDRAPDQLARGVVTQVQLRGQDKQVHRQPRPRTEEDQQEPLMMGGILNALTRYSNVSTFRYVDFILKWEGI